MYDRLSIYFVACFVSLLFTTYLQHVILYKAALVNDEIERIRRRMVFA